MSKLKVRYNLNGRTIKRNFSDLNKPLGTQQLVAIINWGFKENFNRVDGMHWIPVPADELAKMKIPNDPRRIRELQEKSPPHIKYTGSFSGKKDLFSVKHYYKSYKVTVQGRLVKYHRLKLQTDLYILPISWNAKSQIASAPYAWINDELKKITHIIETTFQEVIKLKDFSKERLDELLKERMKNGMPRHIYVPANIAANNAQAIHEISKTLAKDAGIEAYDIRNPKNVPDDLTEFIDYYYKNTIKLKKGSDETYERHQQFKRKLIRWYEATGKKLSITLSDEVNIGDFLKWRM